MYTSLTFFPSIFHALEVIGLFVAANSLGKTGRQATQAVGAVGEKKALVID